LKIIKIQLSNGIHALKFFALHRSSDAFGNTVLHQFGYAGRRTWVRLDHAANFLKNASTWVMALDKVYPLHQ